MTMQKCDNLPNSLVHRLGVEMEREGPRRGTVVCEGISPAYMHATGHEKQNRFGFSHLLHVNFKTSPVCTLCHERMCRTFSNNQATAQMYTQLTEGSFLLPIVTVNEKWSHFKDTSIIIFYEYNMLHDH